MPAEPKTTTPPAAAPTVDAKMPRALAALKHEVAELPPDYNADTPDDPAVELDDRSPLFDVFYFCPDDEHEHNAAKVWKRKHAPEVPAGNLLRTLPLDKLNSQSVVFVLVRKGQWGEPVSSTVPITGRNREGFLAHETRKSDDVANEFKAYGPINAQAFWTKRSNRFTGGLNYEAFCDELGKYIIPFTIGYRDAPDKAGGPRGHNIYMKSA